MAGFRLYLTDFATANPLYSGATVYVYEVDPTTQTPTTTLATIYDDIVGTGLLTNPLQLDDEGKWQQSPYVETAVVMEVRSSQIPSHTTGITGVQSSYRGDWEPGQVYLFGDTVRDGAAGGNTLSIYISVTQHTAGSVWADDLAAGKWQLFIQVPAAGDYVARTGDTMSGKLTISSGGLQLGSSTATAFGTAIGQVPLWVNFQGSGFPGLLTSSRLVIARAASGAGDFADLQINRTTTSVVSTNTAANNAALRVIGVTGAQNQTSEWGIVSQVTNNQNTGAGNTVAIIGYGFKTMALNGAFTFGGVFGAFDSSGLPSSTAKGTMVGAEIDVAGYDVDDSANGQMWGSAGSRVGLNIVALRQSASGSAQTQISQGLWFSTSTNPISAGSDSATNFNSMIGAAVNAQAYQMLDARGVIAPTGYTDPVAAVRMAAGQVVDLNGGPELDSAAGDTIGYTSSGTARIRVMSGANENFSVSASAGNVITRGTLQVNASGSAPITISSGSIAVASSQAMNIVTGGAGFAVNIGNAGAGLGQVMNVTTNSGGNSLDGSSGNVLNVANRITAGFYQSTGITHSLSGSTMTKMGMSLTEAYTGTTTATDPNAYRLAVSTDTVDASGATNSFTGLNVARNFGGTGTKGSRGGLRVQLTQTGGAYTDTSTPSFIGVESWLALNANIGGTGTGTSAKGLAYGSNNQVLLQPGATYFRLANANGETNLAVYGTNQRLTLGGTVTAGDTLNVIFTGGSISGSPVTVSWVTGASQTLTMVANNLEAAINSNTALRNAGISAKGSSGNVEIYWIATLSVTVTTSQSGSGTTTMSLGGVTAGASVDVKLMQSLISLNADSSPALGDSAYLLLGSQGRRAPGGQLNAGIWFGSLPNYDGAWGISPQGTMIGAGLQLGLDNTGKSGFMPPNKAKYGVDLRYVSFDSTGAAWRSSGYIIGYDGTSYIGGSKLFTDSTGLNLDATTGATASAVALSSGGGGGSGTATNNYFVGDIGYVNNGVLQVTGVNAATGAVTTFNVLVYPSYTSGSAPSNPVSVDGGSGTGWTVTITWPTTSNNIVYVQPTGGKARFGGTIELGSSGPTIRTGTGAASGTQPKGSIWIRTDGAAGSTIYVSQGGGTWNAVAGV